MGFDPIAPLRLGTRVIVQYHGGQVGTVRGHTARAGVDPGYLITMDMDGGTKIEAPRWHVFPAVDSCQEEECAA